MVAARHPQVCLEPPRPLRTNRGPIWTCIGRQDHVQLRLRHPFLRRVGDTTIAVTATAGLPGPLRLEPEADHDIRMTRTTEPDIGAQRRGCLG